MAVLFTLGIDSVKLWSEWRAGPLKEVDERLVFPTIPAFNAVEAR